MVRQLEGYGGYQPDQLPNAFSEYFHRSTGLPGSEHRIYREFPLMAEIRSTTSGRSTASLLVGDSSRFISRTGKMAIMYLSSSPAAFPAPIPESVTSNSVYEDGAVVAPGELTDHLSPFASVRDINGCCPTNRTPLTCHCGSGPNLRHKWNSR